MTRRRKQKPTALEVESNVDHDGGCGSVVADKDEKSQEEFSDGVVDEKQILAMQKRLDKLKKNHRRSSQVVEKKKKKRKGEKGRRATLRGMEDVTKKVDRLMDKFDEFSSSDSSSDDNFTSSSSDNFSSSSESDYEKETRRNRKKKSKCRSRRSGKNRKITSYVLNPQEWPHTHLSLHFVNKDIKYEQLSITEFCAGYASILEVTKSRKSFKHRVTHFKDLMYLATKYKWDCILNYHAACLLEIERGHLRWGDNFMLLQSTTLAGGYLEDSGSSLRSSSRRSNQSGAEGPVLFCKNFQRDVCSETGDHFGELNGETRYLRHICARCWLVSRRKSPHPESSESCPVQVQVTGMNNNNQLF